MGMMGKPPGPPPSSGGAAYATPIYNDPPAPPPQHNYPRDGPSHGPPPGPPLPKEAEGDNLDEFDDLTIEELRSLLDNFKNLSKGEQMDLIRYMKKLELTDPEKVKLLKQSVKPSQKPGTRTFVSNTRRSSQKLH